MTRLRPGTWAIIGAGLLALGLMLLLLGAAIWPGLVEYPWSVLARAPFVVGAVLLSMSIRLHMQERRELNAIARRIEREDAESDAKHG